MSTRAELPPAAVATGAAASDGPTLGQAVRERLDGLRAGDLGSLPILVGIVAIAVYFQARNDNFLTSGNFVNLIVQMAAIAVIGMGITFVLLLGEIDLSIGYVSGVGGVVAALLLRDDGNAMATAPAIALALGAGVTIGVLQGLIFARVGIPSFVVTLAGLLGWNGVVLLLIGSNGTVVIQNGFLNDIANAFMGDAEAWIILEAAVAAWALVKVLGRRKRSRTGLPNAPLALDVAKVVAVAVLVGVVVEVANGNRGVPYVGLLLAALLIFWTVVAERTRFGRHVYAVGGNEEAARRAGINVTGIKVAVFGICSGMAALGGLVLASRLSSVDTSSGSGSILLYSIAAPVIGGTSLFGGRGRISAALLGAVVIAMIDNGLGLLNVSSGTKFVVTGIVLLAAVTLDSLSRRGRASAGRV